MATPLELARIGLGLTAEIEQQINEAVLVASDRAAQKAVDEARKSVWLAAIVGGVIGGGLGFALSKRF